MNNNAQTVVTMGKVFYEERYTATINERNHHLQNLLRFAGIKSIKCNNQQKSL